MERRDDPLRSEQQEPDPSPAAVRLAVALAERLDAVVSAPFRVRAEGGWVALYHGETLDGSAQVAETLDQATDRAALARYAAWAAEQVLSSVQDGVAEWTTEWWPLLPGGGMALPGARTDGEHVYLWYGPDGEREAGAVLAFPPISVADLGSPG